MNCMFGVVESDFEVVMDIVFVFVLCFSTTYTYFTIRLYAGS